MPSFSVVQSCDLDVYTQAQGGKQQIFPRDPQTFKGPHEAFIFMMFTFMGSMLPLVAQTAEEEIKAKTKELDVNLISAHFVHRSTSLSSRMCNTHLTPFTCTHPHTNIHTHTHTHAHTHTHSLLLDRRQKQYIILMLKMRSELHAVICTH